MLDGNDYVIKLLEQVNFHFRFFFVLDTFGPICCCVILTFGSYIFGSFFATQIGRSICCFVCAPGDTYIWKLHFWIIFCNTNWWINMLFCACRVFGSFFLLMNWWILSFTPCPFALVYSTFSNSGLVCVMSEPSHLQLRYDPRFLGP